MIRVRGEVHPISGQWKGQLAIVARPRGGDWLEDEVRSWRESGVDVIVSLLTSEENAELGLTEEGKTIEKQGIAFVSFPINDYGVPNSQQSVIQLAQKLTQSLSEGKSVGIHCRQSVGRSGLLAAVLLVVNGEDPIKAFEIVRSGRGAPVPDTNEQRAWVYSLAEKLKSQTDTSTS